MDWILLTYKLHDNIENMLIPPAIHPKPPDYKWVFYASYALWKLYSFR